MSKLKKIVSIILIFVMVLVFASCEEDVSLQTIKYKGYISVGYYPGSYINEPVAGVIETIAKNIDVEVTYVSQTPETWQADLHNGVIDVMIDESNDIDIKSDVIMNTRILLVKDKGLDMSSAGKIGIIDTDVVRDSADAIASFHSGEYKYYALPEVLVADLQSKNVDAIIINDYEYQKLASLDDVDYDIINHRDVYVTFNDGDTTLVTEFNMRLRELRESGLLSGIIYNSK